MNCDTSRANYLHTEYPKQFARDQFWQQIKRTVNGEPVSDRDIQWIVEQIATQLDLHPHNHILDLGCGNGALAAKIFDRVSTYTGVDFSRYLLDVAQQYFQPHDRVVYVEADIRRVDDYSALACRTDKILIYGCIAYLSKQETTELVRQLKDALPKTERILVGNIPNRTKAPEFFDARKLEDYQLDRPDSPIGVWWEPSEFVDLGREAGFDAEAIFMPSGFYGHNYRFDIVLSRRQPLSLQAATQQAHSGRGDEAIHAI